MLSQKGSRPDSSGCPDLGPWLSLGIALLSLVLAAGCAQSPKSREEIAGVYKQVQPAGAGLEQIYTLELRNDSSCSLSREYVKKGKVVERGTWTNDRSKVVVCLIPKRTNRPPEVVEFKCRGLKLTSTKWDQDIYGQEGLGTFTREQPTNAPPR